MGVKERKLRELKSRKNLILDTAKELFAEKGFSSVTLDDIATAIEFSKGTIYTHFKSKEEIYALILLNHLNVLLTRLKEAAKACKDTASCIRSCLDTYIEFYRKHREYFKLLFFIDLMSNQYKIPSDLLKEIQRQKIACLIELQDVIKKGMASKEIHKDYPFTRIALVLWGMTNGVIHLAESKQIKIDDLDRLINVGFEIVINGLKNKNK
jgi:AcrR family transcriptional regulator